MRKIIKIRLHRQHKCDNSFIFDVEFKTFYLFNILNIILCVFILLRTSRHKMGLFDFLYHVEKLPIINIILKQMINI